MDKTVEKIVDKNSCTGCQLCYNVCDFYAVHIELSTEGFYIPKIDYNKCTNCGKCLKYCPMENRWATYDDFIKVYSAKSNDEETRMKSSSGGIFSEIAKDILEEQGIVFGAAFNKENKLVHIDIDSETGLQKLRGSKYIQSYINLSYRKLKDYLIEDKKVLFVGTPCQANALRNYIGMNDNLFIVDLVCHGVSSIKIFEKYLKYILKNEKVIDIHFRSKEEGWNNYQILISGEKTVYKKSHKQDPFFYGYLKNLYLNKICYDCPFSKMPRVSDITLGDFWGVNSELDDDKGVSLVIVNSNRGQKMLDNLILKNRISIKQSDIVTASSKNPRVVDGKMSIPNNRRELFMKIDTLTFEELDNTYIKSPKEKNLQRVIDTIKIKPIVIFGTGSGGIRVFNEINKLEKKELKYFVDNDVKKEGDIFCGMRINKPEKLLLDKNDGIFIVVASSYYEEISEQLKNMGFKEDIDFIDGLKYF